MCREGISYASIVKRGAIAYIADMAVREIVIHPDPRLKKVCEPVDKVDERIQRLADDMLETMYAAPGIGLAAPQIGITRRLIVMDCAGKDEAPRPYVLVNPEIVWASVETNVHEEGCLSIPGEYGDVERPAEVKVRFLDRNGEPREEHFKGLEATCVQHEIDHIDGKLFIDYLSPVRRRLITEKMKKLKRERARSKAKAAG